MAPGELDPLDQPGIICAASGAGVLGWLPLGLAVLLVGAGLQRRRR